MSETTFLDASIGGADDTGMPPLRWLRDALARKALAEHMSHYYFSGSMAAATDGNLTASHPLPFTVPTCLVKGEHLEAANRVFASQPEFSLADGFLSARSGRAKARMPVLDATMWTPTQLRGDWRPVPAGLVDMLTDLLPFVADGATNTAWMGCIAVAEDALWATDRIVMARSKDPIDVAGINILLARSTVEFVVDRAAGLTEWCLTPEAVGFRWSNGAWMRSTLVQGEWPVATARRLLSEEVMATANHVIDDAWRGAVESLLASAAATSNSTIELRNEAMTSEGNGLFVEIESHNLLPEGMPATQWSAGSLKRLVDKAQRWNPARSPAPFVGHRVVGVVARHVGSSNG